ncbi:hypothetical protein DM02DRAFT_615883 [Periconia macrospinosa]|uniref:Uncharacterized protein n=1 Tax=Periconia macrospinosa TaxID=97972 RepID=A0A2V1DJK5_9PLEO|nr:hypothetical protein DM02DRAFT_615883 [Periconia macrospinosa]
MRRRTAVVSLYHFGIAPRGAALKNLLATTTSIYDSLLRASSCEPSSLARPALSITNPLRQLAANRGFLWEEKPVHTRGGLLEAQ